MAKSIRLQTRDRLILEHIHQFNLTTPYILKDQFFEDKKMAAVESVIRRLRKHGLVRSYQIPSSKRVCYLLEEKGGDIIGQSVKSDDFQFHKLGSSIGMLHFICRPTSGTKRVRCNQNMLRKLIADDVQRFPRINFYMSEKQQPDTEESVTSLGFVVVDLKNLNRRLNDRCVNHSRKFIRRGWFAEIMKSGRFEITVLTGSESKKNDLLLSVPKELRRQLRGDIFKHGLKSEHQFPINFDVEVIPELDEVVPFKKDTKRSDSAKRVSPTSKRRRR